MGALKLATRRQSRSAQTAPCPACNSAGRTGSMVGSPSCKECCGAGHVMAAHAARIAAALAPKLHAEGLLNAEELAEYRALCRPLNQLTPAERAREKQLRARLVDVGLEESRRLYAEGKATRVLRSFEFAGLGPHILESYTLADARFSGAVDVRLQGEP